MFVSFLSLSLATSLFVHSGAAIDLDVKDEKSIKDVAKTLADGIVARYNDGLKAHKTPGLFGDPYYWWEAGAVFDSLIDYSALTGDKQFDDLIAEALVHQSDSEFDFMAKNQSRSIGNDDQSYWGLAAMSAAEHDFPTSKLGNRTWIDLAKNVWDSQVRRWDEESCGGGFHWQIFQFNSGYTYKNTVSQGQFMLLSARLAKFTGNSTYSDWAQKVFKWTQDTGLVDDKYHAYDGADSIEDCTKIDRVQWTSNNGIFAEAAALMFNLTDGNEDWKKAVTGFINVTSANFKKDKVLYEVACELNGKCNTDQRAFKGLAVRSLARAAVSAPFVSDAITTTLENSAESAAKKCKTNNDNVDCKLRWWNYDGDDSTGLGEAFSALAVVQGLLVKDAKAPVTQSSSSSGNGNGNGTTTGNPTGNAPESSGSANPADHDGAAGALVVSRGLMVAGVLLVAALF